MAASEVPDYYAVLQVRPNAEREVIEAAYRQLMKKYHPDLAGTDPQRVADHLTRAKALNKAFSVLRDPVRRKQYDDQRWVAAGQRPPSASARPRPRPQSGPSVRVEAPPTRNAHSTPTAPPTTPPPIEVIEVDLPDGSVWWSPFRMISDAYYLLPGAYEWEPGHRTELIAVACVPVIGVAGFCLATGRLAGLLGASLNVNLAAWAVLLFLAIPMWQQLPRVIAASAPSILLMSGALGSTLEQVHLPVWLAWFLLSLLSLILAARLLVFAVLPTLAACLLIARFA